jgi:hypothetical protein
MNKKVMAKDLLGPMAGEGGGIISSEPKVIAMGFAPALISFRKKTEAQKGPGGEGGGSSISRDTSRG